MNVKNPSFERSCKPPRQGAAIYISVLSTAVIVSLLGLTSVTLLRLERRHATSINDRLIARSNAGSAVEFALKKIDSDSNWRTTYVNGVETTPLPIGPSSAGTVSFILEDSDASLTDGDTNLRIKGIGRVGNTVQVSSVEISGNPVLLDSLQCSVYAVRNVTQSSNSTTNGGPFASGSMFTVNGTVTGNVEGNPVLNLGTVTGTIQSPVPPRTMPSPSVWDTYVALATVIPYTSFPLSATDPNTRIIDRELLSGNVNPYGAVNTQGIYYVQIPSGKSLTASKSRFHCTMVIELLGTATFDTTQSCLWDPYNGNAYPCAIIKGNGSGRFELKSSNATLKESQTPKKNFNPPGDPYDGITNLAENDSYIPKMRGLFHIIGSNVNTVLASNLILQGVVVTEGTLTLGANLDVTMNPSIFSNPPLGYGTQVRDMAAVSGSWVWDSAP